jgi:hypothetical protein
MRRLDEISSMEEYCCKMCVSTFPREIDFQRHKKLWKHREFPPEGVKIGMRRISNQYSAAAEYGFKLLAIITMNHSIRSSACFDTCYSQAFLEKLTTGCGVQI